jgi:uncharacterized protein
MRERVVDELQRIERQYGVRVLLAVESGSRAWGFASPDSDYDVRFIYNHHRDWYISVAESRDVIEEMLPGDLDVSGWDLRKMLRLFGKCNIALNEWLGSPIVYCQAPTFREQLLRLMPSHFNPVAGLHHYRSMAVRTLEENLEGEPPDASSPVNYAASYPSIPRCLKLVISRAKSRGQRVPCEPTRLRS